MYIFLFISQQFIISLNNKLMFNNVICIARLFNDYPKINRGHFNYE